VHSTDTAEPNCAGSPGDLILAVAVFEPRVRLILELLPHQPGFKILLVSEVDFVVSFIHLECAPFDCIVNMLIPITINNGACFRLFSTFLAKIHAGSRTSYTVNNGTIAVPASALLGHFGVVLVSSPVGGTGLNRVIPRSN
jgi:hypothetical protein